MRQVWWLQTAQFKSPPTWALLPFCSPRSVLLFNLHRFMVCMTLLQGIVGDVKGYTMSFHPFMCMQTYFQLSTQPVKTHTQKTLPPVTEKWRHTHTQTYTWCSASSPFPGLPNGRMASSSHLCLIHLLLPKLHMRVSMSAEYYFCDVMYYSCTSYFSCTEQKIVVWTNTLFQEAEAAFAGRLCDYNSWDRGRWDFNRWNKTYYKARERVWKCVS